MHKNLNRMNHLKSNQENSIEKLHHKYNYENIAHYEINCIGTFLRYEIVGPEKGRYNQIAIR